MSNTFQRIPDHLILRIGDYLEKEAKLALIKSCKEWCYSKVLSRLCKLSLVFDDDCGDWFEHIDRVQISPSKELLLSLSLGAVPNAHLLDFLHRVKYQIHTLNCDAHQFLAVMNGTNSLTVKVLVINSIKEDGTGGTQHLYDCLLKVKGCQNFDFQSEIQIESSLIPYMPNLLYLRLRMTSFQSDSTLLKSYSRTLHHLSLEACNISDVSMLGFIPHLKLRSCNNIEDISSLNNNDHVEVEYCTGIVDYSQSFANSRTIRIASKDGCDFDLSRWSRVEDLTLFPTYLGDDIYIKGCNSLPKTVRRCALSGNFVSVIDFTVTSHHVLQELSLSSDSTITSLERYGLERLTIIKCEFLNLLQSLEGLGRGKNHKITINTCPEIKDFSPLKNTPIVSISLCKGFTSLSSLTGVRDLTITSFQRFHVESCFLPNLYSLCISHTESLEDFDGLQRIPYLQLHCETIIVLQQFLKQGKRLENQRIVFINRKYYSYDYGYHFIREVPDTYENPIYLDIHHSFLQNDYIYYDQLPKKWIWLRK